MKFFALCMLVLSLAVAVFSAPAVEDNKIDGADPEGRFFIDYFMDSDSSCSSSSEEHFHHHYYQQPATTPKPVVPT